MPAGSLSMVNLAPLRGLTGPAIGQRSLSTGCPVYALEPFKGRVRHGCRGSRLANRKVILPAHGVQKHNRSRRCGGLLAECLSTEMPTVKLPAFRSSTERLIDMSVNSLADGGVCEPRQQTKGDVIEVDRRAHRSSATVSPTGQKATMISATAEPPLTSCDGGHYSPHVF